MDDDHFSQSCARPTSVSAQPFCVFISHLLTQGWITHLSLLIPLSFSLTFAVSPPLSFLSIYWALLSNSRHSHTSPHSPPHRLSKSGATSVGGHCCPKQKPKIYTYIECIYFFILSDKHPQTKRETATSAATPL